MAAKKKAAAKKTASKKKAAASKGGRPTQYTSELGTEICRRLAEGESLNAICKDERMPARSTAVRWVIDDAGGEFSDKYARARAAQAELMSEEMLEIADEKAHDLTTDAQGNETVDQEVLQRSRLRVDTRKWIMSRMAPRRWGDRQQVEHSGGVNVNLSFNVGHSDDD